MDLKLTMRRVKMHEFIVHQKPDPEVIIKCLYGTTSKGLAEKIQRGEVELPKAGEGANE